MNDKKIAAIIHKVDGRIFAELTKSLKSLTLPEGFTLDIIPAKGTRKFFAYNEAMEKSDAKYKLYLDENLLMLDKNILVEIIKIFQEDEKIGVIGVSGALEISTHGVALNSPKHCGKVFFGRDKAMNDWGGSESGYTEVEAVDDFFLATQYDITWRHDLFKKNFFCCTAQCLEFRRKGYKSVVVTQDKPWVWNRTEKIPIDETERAIFLYEYSKDIYPLVSIIIPTFNRPEYFKVALESALNQTYRNFEIFISDNSTNDDTENLMQDYLKAFKNIKYFHHKDFTASDNWNFAREYNNPDAEFVNWLLDDDMFYPQKLEIMVEVMRQNPDCSIVASPRHTIDAKGNVNGQMPDYKQYPGLTAPIKLLGEEAGKLIFDGGHNYIGEPTTPLIRKSCLRDNDLCWTDEERGFYALVDLSTWCQLLEKGNLFWLGDVVLSAFRRHEGQATNWVGSGANFEVSWARLFKIAWEKKVFIKDEKDLRFRILNWLYSADMRLMQAFQIGYYDETFTVLEKTMTAMTQALYNGYEINLPPREYSKNDGIKFLT